MGGGKDESGEWPKAEDAHNVDVKRSLRSASMKTEKSRMLQAKAAAKKRRRTLQLAATAANKAYYGDERFKGWKRSLTPDNAGKRRKICKREDEQDYQEEISFHLLNNEKEEELDRLRRK
nr:hypothetical protein BE08_19000 [Ipomoea batatas]